MLYKSKAQEFRQDILFEKGLHVMAWNALGI